MSATDYEGTISPYCNIKTLVNKFDNSQDPEMPSSFLRPGSYD